MNARWLEQNYPTLASEIKSLPWVSDGIDNMESEVVQELLNIAAASRPTVSSIVRLGWVRDGIEEMEVKAIEDISYLSNADPDEALRIVRMQFLASLESSDVAALESLAKLATLNARDFRRVMAHPTLIGGIYDDWGKVVATLYGVSETNPKLIDVLLNPDRVRLNTLAINLPRAGEVELAIIRTDRHMASPYSMDLLEHAVRNIEEFMAAPFPNGYVGLLFGEAVLGGSAGTNYGTHMSILPEYDVDDGSYYAEYAGHIIAHEVAHYYWIGNVDWVDEGTADFAASVSENARTGRHLEPTNSPCAYTRTIAELESWNIERDHDAFTCNYALGERFFVDLYRGLGDIAFRQGLRNLYLMSQQNGAPVGMEHVRTAFKANGAGIAAPIVDKMVARWYDGIEPYDTSAKDSTPYDLSFRTVNGRINEAYISTTQEGPPLSSSGTTPLEDSLWLYLAYDYSVGSNVEVPLEIVTYFEDGFVFSRRDVPFTAQPGYTGGWWWVQIGHSPGKAWAPGEYSVSVYNEGKKLFELEYWFR